MSQAGPAPSQTLVTELKVSGHLMTLEKGLFCVFHAPGSPAADPQTGLPGVRVSHPPMQDRHRMHISSFDEDGWIGAAGSAALVRVNDGPSQLLVTIYQNGAGQHEAPKLQVMRLGDVSQALPAPPVPVPVQAAAAQTSSAPATDPAPASPGASLPTPVAGAEVAAHVQRRGDKLGKLGEWMGEPGSQSWIEGFAISPNREIGPEDIEYQAVLGKGWLSPWSEGGQYCGSRGMALPILGLRVRLKGAAADTHTLRVRATFTDGSKVGPIPDTETAEAESLAPLEAFRIEILPQEGNSVVAPAMADTQTLAASAGEPAPRKPASKPAINPPGNPPGKPPGKPVARQAVAKPPSAQLPSGKLPSAMALTKPVAKPVAKPGGKSTAAKPGRPFRR